MPLPFSIVIPTYNEAAGIGKLLGALDAAFRENGLDGEIIVVDDNSPDGTGRVVNVLPKMVAALESGEYGLAVGSRYVAGGGIANWPARRVITSRVACWLARPLTRVRDVTSGFFLVRRDALAGVKLDPIGFKIGLEVIAKARYGKAIEIPYVFRDRVEGVSKLNQREIFNYVKQLARLYAAAVSPTTARERKAGSL